MKLNSDKNIWLDALAGCGKTTALVNISKLEQMKNKSILYLVFNKLNQLEAEEKFGENVTCLTTNSFGHKTLQFNGYSFDKFKNKNIIKKFT